MRHSIKEYDYPTPWKDVLILSENGRFLIGYYKGETDVYPWFDYFYQMNTKGIHYVYWYDLPPIPDELR